MRPLIDTNLSPRHSTDRDKRSQNEEDDEDDLEEEVYSDAPLHFNLSDPD